MTFLFDLDNTICTTQGTEYARATPIPEMVDAIRELHAAGHTIYFFTARGFMGGPTRVQTMLRMTRKQLAAWGVPFDGVYAKPAAGLIVDDQATNVADFRLCLRMVGGEPK